MTACTPLELRIDRNDDGLSTTELAGRVRSLLRLRERSQVEHARLLLELVVAETPTARRQLAQEARAARDAALGAEAEANRLRALAGLLRRLGAAW